ncbi:unnamed protein product [Protopolystoma xenopodis]|uniref:Uncharacterized protein n=1 Tax=Protopolystoma xenopodis TaxID=117903 RepID=A0A3S5B3E5_9PLAT|nr:unnamed protein product [Protopolystoma xenopodis]
MISVQINIFDSMDMRHGSGRETLYLQTKAILHSLPDLLSRYEEAVKILPRSQQLQNKSISNSSPHELYSARLDLMEHEIKDNLDRSNLPQFSKCKIMQATGLYASFGNLNTATARYYNRYCSTVVVTIYDITMYQTSRFRDSINLESTFDSTINLS